MLQIVYRKLAEMHPHPDNPRKPRPGSVQILAESIKQNPDYFEARPIILSNRTGELVIIDGERRSEAALYLGLVEVPSILMEGLTYEREMEILVKGNTHTGVWDEVKLATEKWKEQKAKLLEWGIDKDLFEKDKAEQQKKATEILSQLQYDTLYYEPKEKPTIDLQDCLDLSLYEKKLDAINASKLPAKRKEVLKMFAYRFIRIDFENVANYYAFKATEEEKKVIERLRLVLVDTSVNGFVEDDLLRISQIEIDKAKENGDDE